MPLIGGPISPHLGPGFPGPYITGNSQAATALLNAAKDGTLDAALQETRTPKEPIFRKLNKMDMGVSYNAGTQQPRFFCKKMIILGCFRGTTIWGNTHLAKRCFFGLKDDMFRDWSMTILVGMMIFPFFEK